jgi:hypothetical protein
MSNQAVKNQSSETPPKMSREELEKEITKRFNAIKRNDFSYQDRKEPVGRLPSKEPA